MGTEEGVFEWVNGSKEAEAAELLRRMGSESGAGLRWTGEVRFTDVEGMDVAETRMNMCEDEIDDWCTAWFEFADDDGRDNLWVRWDDDSYHAITQAEWDGE